MSLSWETLLVLGAVFGFIYGFLLQRGDMCFVSAFRDFYAFGDTRVLRGIAVALLVTVVGWGTAMTLGWAGPDRLWVPPVGWNSFIGAFVFGVGMYVAGACASGTLYRCGMGYTHFWLTLLSMGVGYYTFFLLFDPLLKPYFFQPLQLSGPLTLYRLLPLPPLVTSLLVATAALALLSRWLGLDGLWRGVRETFAFFRQPLGRILRLRVWDTRAVGLLLGITLTVQFSVWSIWGITGPEARITALIWGRLAGPEVANNPYVAGLFQAYPSFRFGPEEVLIAFIVVGAMVSSIIGGTFRIRQLRLQRVPHAVFGGFLLAFGSRIAPGCNVGNIISGLPALSIHSMIATAGIAAGIYTAWYVAHVRAIRPARAVSAAEGTR